MTKRQHLHRIFRRLLKSRRDTADLLAQTEAFKNRFPEKPPPETAVYVRWLAAVDQQIVLIRDMLSGRRPLGKLPPLPKI
jgi:hypothetical protein